MSSFALYRLPYAEQCTLLEQTQGEPQTLQTCGALNGERGYVFAPFAVTPQTPLLLLRPDRRETMACSEVGSCRLALHYASPTAGDHADDRSRYHVDFSNFHAQLQEGTFRKIVLARSLTVPVDAAVSPFSLFQKACESYPRMFISLVSTPQGGTWLTATPEILLDRTTAGAPYKTVALAGTVPFEEDVRWSEKNIREQRYVATYILETLERFSTQISEEGPFTVRAAHLAHLRSDYTFTLAENSHLGDLLQALHPTPAVCGLPKEDAFRFILHNESSERSYYSGFQGPLDPDGETHLYVSLRCMEIMHDRCRLYAGGGLLKVSDEEQEWQETETKLNTMRNVLK